MFSSMIHFQFQMNSPLKQWKLDHKFKSFPPHTQSNTTTKHWTLLQFRYQIHFINESRLKTLEIRSNHLEDKFDLENESCLKTMEIRSKVQNFPPTSNPTTFELK